MCSFVRSMSTYWRYVWIRSHRTQHKMLNTALCYLPPKLTGLHPMEFLPDDCLAYILSMTSPRDVCKSSAISSMARSLANSDIIWDKFLPPNCHEILSRLVAPPIYSSKKDLFLSLSKPLLIDHGNKAFSIEKSTGKICYMLSARELAIAWGSSPLYWSWKPFRSSRFAEVAELRTICWLEIRGSMEARMLSPRTIYGAYLIVKVADRAYGLDSLPSEVSVEAGNFKSKGSVYVRWPVKEKEERSYGSTRGSGSRGEGKWPRKREDEWLEIELGSFFNEGDGDSEVRMCFKEVKGVHLKGGLIVEGIEIRPIRLEQAFT